MHARILAALGIATLLAGCAQTAQQVPTSTSSPPTPLAFGAPVALPGPGDGEPNIARLPDGTLFVTSPAGGAEKPNAREGSAYLWRSRDDGASWSVLRSPRLTPETVPAAGTFCSCDADVVTSPDGWVYYSDWWITGLGFGPGNYLVESSADGGDTWTTHPAPVPQNLVASMDRQWLVAGPDGFVGLFYSFFGATPVGSTPVPAAGLDRPAAQIEAVFSHDHGESWTDPLPVVPAQDGHAYQIAHPRLATDGTLWMPYGDVDARKNFWSDPSEVRVAVSTDQGRTWSRNLVAGVPHGFDNLWAVQGAQDPDTGRATIVWAARESKEDAPVYESHASSVLGNWSGPRMLAAHGVNALPWVVARNGTTVAGWYGSPYQGDPAKAPASTAWDAWAARWREDDAGVQTSKVSAVPVKTGAMCPRGAACAGNRQLLDYVSIELDPAGNAYFAFASAEGPAVTVHVAKGR